nr:MAG TPA: Protein of unknown function (DUF2897) [Caudoviricetes sp.]
MTIVWIFCFIGVGACVSGLMKLVDWMEGKR